MATNLNYIPSDFIPRIKADLDRSVFLIGGFFLLIIFLKVGLKMPLPNEIFLMLLLLLLIASFLMFFFRKLKDKEPEKTIKLHFVYNIFQMVFLTIIVYYTGGITWITPIFYTFAIINSFWIYPRNLSVLVLAWCSALFISLTALQYLRILPAFYIFHPLEQNFQNFYYVLLTTIGALAVLFFVGFFSNTFYTLLNNKIRELEKTRKTLEKTKIILKIEFRKKTEEAEEGKIKLEAEVKGKTKELEEKRKAVQEKVKELEKFHAVAVEREIKMINLKREISKIRKSK